MKKTALLLCAALLWPAWCFAGDPPAQGRSVIVEARGTAARGEDRSRKETMDLARQDAKRAASENARTFIRSETRVEDFVTEKDVVEAFSKATVKVLEAAAPFGRERIRVFAATSPLGEINTEAAGDVFAVKDGAKALGEKTRGLVLKPGKQSGGDSAPAEFFETTAEVETLR